MRVSNDGASLLRVFAARQIATAISEAEFVDHAEAPVVAHERLTTRRFDQAPVTQDGRLVGWVSTSTLKAANNVKSVLRPLSRSALVSGQSPISQVLELLAKDGFVFVVGEGGIDGFVTPSDLDRHAVRSHFYLLVAGIELLLAEAVRTAVHPDVVLARVHGDVRARWEAAYAANSETSPVEYLYLQDLAELFLSHSAEGASPGARGCATS